MQELVQVKQKQTKVVKHLLGSAIDQGQTYFRELVRLDHEDTARNMERVRHTQIHTGQEMSGLGSDGYPSSHRFQKDTVYAKVTRSNNVNNNANVPVDGEELCDHQVTAADGPVYRIRSLPHSGTDDTIMITTTELPSLPDTTSRGKNKFEGREQVSSKSPRSSACYSRQNAPLPPIPSEDTSVGTYSLAHIVPPTQPPAVAQYSSGIYSLAHDVPPAQPPAAAPPSTQYSSRQYAPLPPPPTPLSTVHTETEEMTDVDGNSSSQSNKLAGWKIDTCRGDQGSEQLQQRQDDDDTFSVMPNATPQQHTIKWLHTNGSCRQSAPLPPPPPLPTTRGNVSRVPQPHETRRNVPLPPLPPPATSEPTNGQNMFTKHENTLAAVCVDTSALKQQLLTSTSTPEPNKLSACQFPQRSRSPSPPAPRRWSPEMKLMTTPSSLPPLRVLEIVQNNSKMSEPRSSSHYSYLSQTESSTSTSHQVASLGVNNCGEEAPPPPPPPRTSSTPTESPPLPLRKVSSENTSGDPSTPPVPPRKASGGKSTTDPTAPPLPSHRSSDSSDSGMPLLPVHKTSDSSEPGTPPLPSRKILQEQSILPSYRLARRNATRTRSSESLPERNDSIGEGIIARSAMQRRLEGILRSPSRNGGMSSSEFNGCLTPPMKSKLGKRQSDPGGRQTNNQDRIPIHKMPLPPIPVQIHCSTSLPQLVDEAQDIYEDLDKACEGVNQDLPQFNYEDIDMQTDEPQDHYEDIDMDGDKPQDYYEDIDLETEDRPQEVYEDINSDAAQRVSFVMTVPQDYTPPIIRKSMAYTEEDEPQDYTPPIRRGGVHTDEDEPQDYTPPIRRNRVYVEDEEPQEYTPPIRRSAALEHQDEQSLPPPPLPARSSSRQYHRNHRHRVPVTVPLPPQSRDPVSTKDRPISPLSSNQQYQPSSLSQQQPNTVAPPPISPSTRSHSTSRSPIPCPSNRPHAEPAPPPIPPSSQATPQHTSVGVPAPPPALPPPTDEAPHPPPPPPIGFKAPRPELPPVHPPSNETDASQSKQAESSSPGSLLAGLRNVQLKNVSEHRLPQKAPPTSSSGSTFSTANLLTEMQSLQLRKTKRPNVETAPSPVDGTSTCSTVPFHAVLRPTQNQTPQPGPHTKSPAVRPKPNKAPRPSVKPKPLILLASKHNPTPPPLPPHSSSHKTSQSHDPQGAR